MFPKVDDVNACTRMAQTLMIAGYSTVGLTIPTGLLPERVKSIRQTFQDQGIATALRIDLGSSSRTELLRSLRRFRNAYDVVGVKCVNARVATVASRDRRVDIVFFDPVMHNVRFTHSLARLLHGALEVNLMISLLALTDTGILFRLRRAIAVAQEHNVKVVLSSGARDAEMVRAPRQLSAIASTLGLSETASVAGVSSVPLFIITENVKKRKPEYVEEGVKIIVSSRR
ncbi:MAG: RNase P subunit p30 family protein [Candidatus Bathyarchaeia archaeon]